MEQIFSSAWWNFLHILVSSSDTSWFPIELNQIKDKIAVLRLDIIERRSYLKISFLVCNNAILNICTGESFAPIDQHWHCKQYNNTNNFKWYCIYIGNPNIQRQWPTLICHRSWVISPAEGAWEAQHSSLLSSERSQRRLRPTGWRSGNCLAFAITDGVVVRQSY